MQDNHRSFHRRHRRLGRKLAAGAKARLAQVLSKGFSGRLYRLRGGGNPTADVDTRVVFTLASAGRDLSFNMLHWQAVDRNDPVSAKEVSYQSYLICQPRSSAINLQDLSATAEIVNSGLAPKDRGMIAPSLTYRPS